MSTMLPNAPTRTPVALLVFNRPDLTAQVFETIRAARPERLLVVADGPRNARESALCKATRDVIRVDWPCELETNYSEENLGCKQRVASGIDWIFERCEDAIILEDDCLPTPSFYPYCTALLDRYRDDERVMCVSGTNTHPGPAAGRDESYYFIRYGQTTGWASWRRAWRHFDVEMKDWPQVRREGRLRDVFSTREERWFWTLLFDEQYAGMIRSWDYQWHYARWMNRGLTAVPARNMIVNLGFRRDATHIATVLPGWDEAFRHHEMTTLVHPPYVLPNAEVDDRYFHEIVNPRGLPELALRQARRLVEQALGRDLSARARH